MSEKTQQKHKRLHHAASPSPKMPAIIIPAYNRPDELRTLLKSVIYAKKIAKIDIFVIVSVDGGQQDVVDTAKSFAKDGVEVRSHAHMGLRDHILKCGDLCNEFGAVLVLEDDLILSPAAFSYIQTTLPYALKHPEIAAISLYAFQHNDFRACENLRTECHGDTFLAQTGSSLGQIWWQSSWNAFRQWLQDDYDDKKLYHVPQRVQNWPKTSWKKLYNFWLVDTHQYSLVPFHSLALCTGGETGTNSAGNVGTYFSRVRTLPGPTMIPDISQMMRMDSFLELDTDALEIEVGSSSIFLKDIEFDLNACKKKKQITKKFIFTRRRQLPEKVIKTFDAGLGNPLLALMQDLEGDGLYLISAQDFDDRADIVFNQTDMRLYMPWVSTKQLITIAGKDFFKGLKRKIRNR